MNKKLIMLGVTAIVMLCFGFSTFVALTSINNLILENNKEKSIQYASQITDEITAKFSEPRAVALSINNKLVLDIVENLEKYSDDELVQKFGSYLKDIKQQFHYDTAFISPVKNLAFYTEHGHTKTINYDNPDDDWFERFRDTGLRYELNIDNDQANDNKTTVYINCRMEDKQGKFLGSCGVGLTMDGIADILRKYESLTDLSIKLVGPDGRIQISSKNLEKRITDRDSTYQGKATPEQQLVIKSYNKADRYVSLAEPDGRFSIIKYIPEANWYVIITYKESGLAAYYKVLVGNALIGLVCLAIILLATNLVINHIENKSDMYKASSRTDALTGIGNRTAYEQALIKLRETVKLQELTVISLDVNSLKEVNDKLGHQAGDEIIKESATIIADFFKEYGKVYRTGGDEFVVIVENKPVVVEKLTKDFKARVAGWKGKLVQELSISIGFARGCDYEGLNFEELLHKADQNMYRDKEEHYHYKDCGCRCN